MNANTKALPALHAITALCVGLCSFGLYMATLCPGLAWGGGDSAKLAIWVHAAHFGYGPCDHPLYVAAAKLFSSCLPLHAPLAYKLNIFSAVCASLTICLLCMLSAMSTGSLTAGICAACAFMVSHTFWMHAVLTEVYTLHTLLLTAVLYALCRWHKSNHDRWLLASSFLFGVGFSNHGLIALCLPGCAVSVVGQWIQQKRAPRFGFLLLMGLCCLAGASLIVALLLQDCLRSGSLAQCTAVVAGMLGSDMLADMRPSFSRLCSSLGYLGYQFPAVGFLLGIIGIYMILFRLRHLSAVTAVILFATYALFPVCYNVRDHYQFAISAYLCFAWCIAFGTKAVQQTFMHRYAGKAIPAWLLIGCLIVAPCLTYYGTAAACDRFNIDVLNARSIPFRNNNWYFLWPPKNGDDGAVRYGTGALAAVESHAVIVGDYTPIMVIQYFQEVEGRRRDVTTHIGLAAAQIGYIREHIGRRPVYVAAVENNPSLAAGNMYLSERHLSEFTVTAAPPVFKVLQKNRPDAPAHKTIDSHVP